MSIIEIRNVSKKFRVYHDKSTTLKERLLFFNRTKYEEHQVLNDISFNVEKGTTIGLIGQNGSGKSTLLKLLTGIIYPDSGDIKINGRVSSLLELGAGFHPDFSGRENIYNNASIFGLSRSEIDKRYNQIVEFSELEEYIDNPVRTYSSGMYMRLAFSVAINVNPDVLLIDEILAVGDASFQKKCFEKLYEFKKIGITIIIVSHDSGAIEKLCDNVVWINDGIIVKYGDARTTINEYMKYLSEKDGNRLEENFKKDIDKLDTNINLTSVVTESSSINSWGNKKVELYNLELLDCDGKSTFIVKTGDDITIRFKYNINREIDSIVFGIAIRRIDDFYCYGTNTFIDDYKITNYNKQGCLDFQIHKFPLLENNYLIDIAVQSNSGEVYYYLYNAYKFVVRSDIRDEGVCKLDHTWSISK